MNVKFVFLFLVQLFCVPPFIHADVIGYTRRNVSESFPDYEAEFGTSVDEGILGILMYAEPLDGCTKIKDRPYPDASGNLTVSAFALIIRGNCDFAIKVLNAQNANYDGVIVFNNDSDELLRMASNRADIADQITIPSVFVGHTSGIMLNQSYLYFYEDRPHVEITAGFSPYSFKYYIVPFITVIASCFGALLLFMGVRYLRNHRRQRRNRLSRQRLKQLPVKQFNKGDEYDVCAICLDEYETGDKLRILPCQHAYHCKCVDPWLTTSKRVCPLCKRKVLSDDEDSNSDSDYSDTDSEQAPLLQNSVASSPNSARFATGFNSENPIQRSYSASTVTTTGSGIENQSLLDEETPRGSPILLHGQTENTPIFHSVPNSESPPIHQITISADVSPNIAILPITQSDDEYSCRSSPGGESEVSSYRDAEEVFVVSGAFQASKDEVGDDNDEQPLV